MKKIALLILFLAILTNYFYGQRIIGVHDSKTRDYANALAVKLQRSISPNTGQNAYAKVIEWVFDEYKNRYEIELEAYWFAKECVLCSERYKCEIDGKLIINADGSNAKFITKWKNSWVEEIEATQRFLTGTAIALGTLYIISNDN